MSHFHILSLGAFMIAAAHYVRNGDDAWYVAWVFSGVALAIAGKFVASFASEQREKS